MTSARARAEAEIRRRSQAMVDGMRTGRRREDAPPTPERRPEGRGDGEPT